MRIGITTPQRPKYNPSTQYPTQGAINFGFTKVGKTPEPPAFTYNAQPAGFVQLINKGVATLRINFAEGTLDPNQPIALNIGVGNSGDITGDPTFGMELIFIQAEGSNELCFAPEPSGPPDPGSLSNRYAFQYTLATDTAAPAPIFRNGQNIRIGNEQAQIAGAEAPFFYVPTAITSATAGSNETITLNFDIQFKSDLTAGEPGGILQTQGQVILDFTVL